jgi:hypothetical protein
MTQSFLDSLVGMPVRQADVELMKNGLTCSFTRDRGVDWPTRFIQMHINGSYPHIKTVGRVCLEMDDDNIVVGAFPANRDDLEIT